MKAVVAAFNQEKALGGAFSVIVQLRRLIVYSTTLNIPTQAWPRSGDGERPVPALQSEQVLSKNFQLFKEDLPPET